MLTLIKTPQGNMHRLQRVFARKLSAIGSDSGSASAESSDSVVSPPNFGSTDSYSYSEEDDATFGLMFLLIVVMILAFFLAYLKVE